MNQLNLQQMHERILYSKVFQRPMPCIYTQTWVPVVLPCKMAQGGKSWMRRELKGGGINYHTPATYFEHQ